ncbi:N-6 DNA methylase [Campylobacter helveticus]|uniref:N-6 DNA methylase n=1 Tax=Campylobacter helveticus TaxID=28898 RepID=UPI002FDBD1DA
MLVEVVQLFENYRLLYANKNQFISDLFEHFLNEGFTQNEGIYFTPTPITRFIWNSLPFECFINLRNKTFPKVIDFACGTEHFLTEGVSAISDYCKANHLRIEDREISRYFYGIDADDRLAMTSQVSMLLNGAGDNKIRFIDGLEYDKEFYGEK